MHANEGTYFLPVDVGRIPSLEFERRMGVFLSDHIWRPLMSSQKSLQQNFNNLVLSHKRLSSWIILVDSVMH